MRYAIGCILFPALLALVVPGARAQGCVLDMHPYYSGYATETTDFSNVYTTVLSDGYSTFTPSAGCTGSGVTHQPRAYNVLGSTGGWGYGTASCITCYLSYQNNQQVAYNETGDDDYPPWVWQTEIFCSLAGDFSNNAPGPHPVNFTVKSWVDVGEGDLHIVWTWASSTGTQSDLSGCTINETVTYPGNSPYVWQAPFPSITINPNPTTGSVPGTDTTLVDDHDLGSPPNTNFQKPYSTASFNAVQTITYSCTHGTSTTKGTLFGPANVKRSINQNPNLSWAFTVLEIIQDGNYLATINPLP
jgi:hypothetical protein